MRNAERGMRNHEDAITPGHPALPNPHSASGRLLALDLGTLRIGLAVCDRDRVMASPHSVVARRTPELDAAFFARLVTDERIGGLVVGLPVNMDGSEGPQATAAREYGGWLAAALGLPVAFVDERLTTHAARALMAGQRMTPQQRKERKDKLAAMLILQAYLEQSGGPAA